MGRDRVGWRRRLRERRVRGGGLEGYKKGIVPIFTRYVPCRCPPSLCPLSRLLFRTISLTHISPIGLSVTLPLISETLHKVAGSPELYPVLLDGPCLPTLMALLSHENTDIAADVVELLAEITGAGEGE